MSATKHITSERERTLKELQGKADKTWEESVKIPFAALNTCDDFMFEAVTYFRHSETTGITLHGTPCSKEFKDTDMVAICTSETPSR